MNKFDKPYRTQPLYDNKKIIELFNRVGKLDTYELLQYSLINQISLDVINNDGDSLIHEIINVDNKKATEKIKLDIIKFLIQNNVNPDLPNKINKTPLHYACFYQYEKIIDYLLTFNVDTNYQDNYGYTPLHYLFLGNIKIFNNKSTIEDFIPITNNNNNNNKLLDIKKKIWEIIYNNNPPLDQFPALLLLNKTIENIFEYDHNIKTIELEYIKYLESINNNSNDLSDINEHIFLFRKNITKYINDKFNNFNKSFLLKIHKSKSDSWSYNNNKSDYSIIESGNSKKWFKKNLNQMINQIINQNNLYNIININNNIDGSYIFKNIIERLNYNNNDPNNNNQINQININKTSALTDIGNYVYYELNGQYYPQQDIYDKFLHINALDYASDIIDVENLKFMGGPRDITISYPPYDYQNNNYGYDYIEINNEINKLKELNNNNKRILYLLSGPISYDTLHNNYYKTNDLEIIYFNLIFSPPHNLNNYPHNNDNIYQNYVRNLYDNFNNPRNWHILNAGGVNPISNVSRNKYTLNITLNNNDSKNIFFGHDYIDMIVYIIFSYYSIIYPNKMIDLVNNKELKIVLYNTSLNHPGHNLAHNINENILTINNNTKYFYPFCNNLFANKWYNIYINKIINNRKKLGSWILGMWYDLMSKYSLTNLKCFVPLKLLMLISYLTNYNDNIHIESINILDNIYNCYKPQIIEYNYDFFIDKKIILKLIKIKYFDNANVNVRRFANDDYNIIYNVLNYFNYNENNTNIEFINLLTCQELLNSLKAYIYIPIGPNLDTYLTNTLIFTGNYNNINIKNHILYIIIIISIIIINLSPAKDNNNLNYKTPKFLKKNPRNYVITIGDEYPSSSDITLNMMNKTKIKESIINTKKIANDIAYLCIENIKKNLNINNQPDLDDLSKYIINFIINIFENDVLIHINNNDEDVLQPGIIMNNRLSTFIKTWIYELFTNNHFINNIDIDKLDGTKDELTNILNIIDAIFNNNNDIENYKINNPTPVNNNIKMIYYKYKTNYTNNIDIICAIILDYYNNLIYNKPLKQTLLDTIFILQKMYYYKYIDINIYKFNSIYDDLLKLNSNNISNSKIVNTRNIFSSNVLPSLYGFYNSVKLNKKEYRNKFELAHILGLYYEGTIQEIDLFHKYHYNNGDLFIIKHNEANIHNYYDNQRIFRSDNYYHSINLNTLNLEKNSIAYPLNYITTQSPPDRKTFYYYYYCINNCYNPPSFNLYCYTILKNINYYQNEMNNYFIKINNILLLLNKGNMTNLKKIYTLYYPAIISLNKIIDNYKMSLKILEDQHKDITNDEYYKKYNNNIDYNYINLAKYLNHINAYIYIYTYLFNQEKIIKLSKFNYYQLPENKDVFKPYLYYNNDDNDKQNFYKFITHAPIYVGAYLTNNDYKIGNINSLDLKLNDYNFITIYNIKESIYHIDKQSELPPSLYNHLYIFYERILIEVIKIIIDLNDQNLYNDTKALIENKYIKIENDNINTLIYHYISKIIEELLIEKINIVIYQNITNLYNKHLLKNNIKIDNFINENIINLNKGIHLSNKNEYNIINKQNNEIINFYEIIKKDNINNNKFILYSNDFSNNKLYKNNTKYYIDINTNLIKILLDHNANPLLYDFDNSSCISKILKNYYYIPLQELKKLNIDINNLNDIEYIKSDIIINIEKIINNETELNIIFKNISENLYNEIENLLYSNQEFGNNIIKYLIDGFYLSSYLIFQHLSSEINIDNDLYYLIDVDINSIYDYYLFNNINIPNDIAYIINNELLNEIEKEYKKSLDTNLVGKINKLKLKISNMTFYNNKFIINKKVDIIENYNNYLNTLDTAIIIYSWNKLFNSFSLNNNNNDLIILNLLVYQKKLIKSNNINSDELLLIKSIFHKLANICEKYFNDNKYTDENNTLLIINNILNYITKIVIGYNLEYTIKRLLFLYFYNNNNTTNESNKIDYANKKIEYIFENNFEFNKSFKQFIYDVTCPLLVKTSVNIFKNKEDELEYEKIQIKDLLKQLVDLLDNSPIFIDEIFRNNLKKKIVLYFDTFISNIILLWYVNIENILKYIINNYRSLEILYILIN